MLAFALRVQIGYYLPAVKEDAFMAIKIEALNGKIPVGDPQIVTGRDIKQFASENADEAIRGFVQVLHHIAIPGETKGDVFEDVDTVGFDDRLTKVRTHSKKVAVVPVDYRRKNVVLTKDGQSVDIMLVGSPGPFGEGVTGYRFTRVPEPQVA